MAYRITNGKRFLLACLALGVVVGAHGQVITLRNTTANTCQYTSMSLAADRSIEVQCTTSDPSSPGSIGFSSSGGSSVTDTAPGVAVTVTRFGNSGTATTATVSYACSATGGYAPQYSSGSATGSVSITGNGTQSFTITPTVLPTGVTSSTISCVLSNAQVATLASPTSFSLVVTASGGGGGGGGGSNCTGAATSQFIDLVGQSGNRAQITNLRNGEIASIRFPAKRVSSFGSLLGTLISFTMPVPGYPHPIDGWQMAISECQGEFNSPPAGNTRPSSCGYFDTSTYGNLKTRAADPFYAWTCRLDPDKNYFLNIRWLDPSTGKSTCPAGACSAFADFSYQQ